MTRAERAARLAAFLEEQAGRSFAWGGYDCCLMPADWWATVTGQDPGATWRDRYRTELGGRRLVARAGGLAALWSAALAPMGANRVRKASLGDVGVVRASLARGGRMVIDEIGAICLEPGQWAAASGAGISMAPAAPIVAWRTPWPTR